MTYTPMTRGSTLLLDTNVLLGATDRSRDSHLVCNELFRLPPQAGVHLVTTPQVLREYLVVATRPVDGNGLGLDTTDAVRNIRTFRTRAHLLPEGVEVYDELISLVESNVLSGKRIHDANVIAAASYHNVSAIITDNTGNYSDFGRVLVLSTAVAVGELRELL
jgi:predicted nucleic acid-binding protein